jgi:hypothetical protein
VLEAPRLLEGHVKIRRGHFAKIEEAVKALRAAGKLPSNLRPRERDHRIISWLCAAGYMELELPSRSAIARHFAAATEQIGRNAQL